MATDGAFSKFWNSIREQLEEKGIDLESICSDAGWAGAKVVCVNPDLKVSVEEMGRSTRDQVVMVRVDEETLKALDAWVQTGAVKSRSEAAALFIREGLKLRERELAELEGALRGVDEAKEKLRQKAKEVLGNDQE